MRSINFRPLAHDDLPRLAEWLNRAHLRRFFQPEPTTKDEVAAKYGPCIRGESPTNCHLALRDGEAFAYLQCYRNADWPDRREVGIHGGISIDLFIADPALTGRGLGHRMLACYVEDVAFPLHPDERLCFIGHEVENTAARACSAAAGFRFVRTYVEGGKPFVLLERSLTPNQVRTDSFGAFDEWNSEADWRGYADF
ncbi:MAG: GNAT family N-acetyltransferase [Caulobacteraceae bacterium]